MSCSTYLTEKNDKLTNGRPFPALFSLSFRYLRLYSSVLATIFVEMSSTVELAPKGVDVATFLNYKDGAHQGRVSKFYRINHALQTFDVVKEIHEIYEPSSSQRTHHSSSAEFVG